MGDVIHHDMEMSIVPVKSMIHVRDEISFPDEIVRLGEVEFLLHASLRLKTIPNHVTIVAQPNSNLQYDVPVNRYVLKFIKGLNKIVLEYSGTIKHDIQASDQESDRSFAQTAGIVDNLGVFLASSTVWYPLVEKSLVSFKISVSMPEHWIAVAQGERLPQILEHQITWVENNPQDEIYLVAGKYTQYHQTAGKVDAQVFLQQADDFLAQKYLDATTQYIDMYSRLIGSYPYKKFALVENFWDSGYGMPSFTLLGPKIIRLPFILHSSYPHEILHNWWGNGVYVDYDKGNWAEGLTAYLADHLIQEQRGKGADYRRNTLQKYTDFVSETRDFALTEFRSRHSSSTAAVGYGKTMMLFHMLRLRLGDVEFSRALRSFYQQYLFKPASYKDLEKVFSESSAVNLADEFRQWVQQPGAPEIRLENATFNKQGSGFVTKVEIHQTQKGAVYSLFLPVILYAQGLDKVLQRTVQVQSRKHLLTLRSSFEPSRLSIDPEFDVFRRLHNEEIPPALSQGFGAEKVLVLLPEKAIPDTLKAYRRLAETWKNNQEGQWDIKMDSEVKRLPDQGAVWLLGWSNRFRNRMEKSVANYSVDIANNFTRINNERYARDDHSILLTARNINNPKATVLWLAAGNNEALPGLTRKLPHYSKYSYLVFKGDEPQNVHKGQWPILNSPMTVRLSGDRNPPGYTIEKRQALAQLPPLFSAARMMQSIEFLASDELQGRELGSPQLDKAAEYIADRFRKAGLEPGGDKGGYFQSWNQDVGLGKGKIGLRNVVGILRGRNSALAKQSIVVAAHYDHLGLGWPDVHKGDKGKIHYGADDNASGIAVMLEFIETAARNWKPERSIVFIAFTGEEAGRLGSLHYVNFPSHYALNQVSAMINLDTVGRLGDQPLTVFGTGSATQWVHIFRGIGFVTGLMVKAVADDFGSSDQKSFLDKGIPAVQFFATAHPDFHRPSDTLDKLDAAGLVKIATILKETVDYLANRIEPLTVTLAANPSPQSQSRDRKSESGRKVSLGTIPDFTYTGPGVKITGVLLKSPAESAGLKAGDVITKINTKTVANLSAFAAVLRNSKAGDTLQITIKRLGQEQNVTAVLKPR